jgi:flagellar hook assembly protein FlgD
LFKWYTYSTGTVPPDAVGGPSLTSHGTRTVVWNGKDGSGAIVPDGNYNLWVEFNETNNTGNPTISIPFTKNSTYQHVQPSNTTYFQNIDLQYFPLSTAGIEVGNDHASISVMPNPTTEQATIQVDLIKNATVQINILASNGKMVYNYAKNNYTVGKHLFLWSPKECGVSSGIYFVHVIINNQNQIYKLIVK